VVISHKHALARPATAVAERDGGPAGAPSVDRVGETPVAPPAPLRLPGLVWTKRNRVLPARRGKWVGNCRGIKAIGPELVLRGVLQERSHNPNEISALNPELVLRDIPGKLA
jgi:hypothetical protein